MLETDKVWPIYKRLFKYLKPLQKVFWTAIFCLFIYSMVDALFIAFIKPFIDHGFANNVPSNIPSISKGGFDNTDVLTYAPFVVIGLFFIRGTSNFIASYSISYISAKLIMVIRQEVFEHYLTLPVSYIDNENSGTLISKVTYDTEQVARASGNALITIVRESLTVVGMLVLMFYMSWKLSLIILAIAPFMGTVIGIVSKRLRKISKNMQTSMGDVTVATEQMLKGHKNVLAFGGQHAESKRFENINNSNRVQNLKLALVSSISQPIIMILGSFALAAVLYVASFDSLRAELTAGTFASIISAMLAILQPIKNLTRVNAEFQRGITACSSVFKLLDTPPEDDAGKHNVLRAEGYIEYKNVMFKYQTQEDSTINNISFNIKKGQTLALVGRSGSGKSTIANLLMRFYTGLNNGTISLDGVNIYDYDLKCLRNQIALVSQNIMLFNDTIANNIAYPHIGDYSEQEILNAAKLAYADEFIELLPGKMQTIIGENGVMLSGGQRQRIAIARAILRNAPVLILDEATSALDTESERAIQNGLDNLRHNRTSIVIAHRLSTIENADNILVLDRGAIIESGKHKELLAQNGIYAKLYEMQFSN